MGDARAQSFAGRGGGEVGVGWQDWGWKGRGLPVILRLETARRLALPKRVVTADHRCKGAQGHEGSGQPVVWVARRLGSSASVELNNGVVQGTRAAEKPHRVDLRWQWEGLVAAGLGRAVASAIGPACLFEVVNVQLLVAREAHGRDAHHGRGAAELAIDVLLHVRLGRRERRVRRRERLCRRARPEAAGSRHLSPCAATLPKGFAGCPRRDRPAAHGRRHHGRRHLRANVTARSIRVEWAQALRPIRRGERLRHRDGRNDDLEDAVQQLFRLLVWCAGSKAK
eukprot:scaffold2972_cov64-Phaeocystis_antarctica.AAC.9